MGLKEDTVEACVPARDFNLKAYAAVNLTQVTRRDWALNPGPVDYCSQATLALVPRDHGRQFMMWICCIIFSDWRFSSLWLILRQCRQLQQPRRRQLGQTVLLPQVPVWMHILQTILGEFLALMSFNKCNVNNLQVRWIVFSRAVTLQTDGIAVLRIVFFVNTVYIYIILPLTVFNFYTASFSKHDIVMSFKVIPGHRSW